MENLVGIMTYCFHGYIFIILSPEKQSGKLKNTQPKAKGELGKSITPGKTTGKVLLSFDTAKLLSKVDSKALDKTRTKERIYRNWHHRDENYSLQDWSASDFTFPWFRKPIWETARSKQKTGIYQTIRKT